MLDTSRPIVPNPLTRKLEQRDRLSDEERRILDGALTRTREVGPDQDMVHQGDSPTESTLLLDGFAARYKLLESGKRQITAIHVAGDFVDLHSFLLKRMDHAIVALTPCKVAVVPHETLAEITETQPHLTRLLWLSTLVDGAVHREWLVAMGRRSAAGHAAHLFCEMFLRLQSVGLVDGNSYQFPLTQSELGDVLGLSTVHCNRVVQELRRMNVLSWRGDVVSIEDWDRLVEVAEFDPTYLNLESHPV